MKRSLLAVLLATAGLAMTAERAGRAEWMGKAQWGVFMHFLGDPKTSAAEWNRQVDGFDVEGLADQLKATGARYFVLTLGQNSGHYLAPNHAYDEIAGITPSKCSRRDLVSELYPALERRGIRLMVYLPAGAPEYDAVAVERFEWKKGDFRNAEFQKKWERVIAEWSVRWGKKVSGWWFDGCYWADTMYRQKDAPNFASFAAAARKGNPDAIVAFNPGVKYPVTSITPEEDYTAGEINEPERATFGDTGPQRAQKQMLSYLGKTWSAVPMRFSDEQAVAHTLRLTGDGAAVTWDVPHLADGKFAADFLRQLSAIGRAVQAR